MFIIRNYIIAHESGLPPQRNVIMAIMKPHGYVDNVEEISNFLNGMRMVTQRYTPEEVIFETVFLLVTPRVYMRGGTLIIQLSKWFMEHCKRNQVMRS